MGVDLFFVLSGFLVSGLLFSDYNRLQRIAVGRFYVRRWWKIYPPFTVLVAATILLGAYHGDTGRWREMFTELFFFQSYRIGLWNHTWSLAVEEHFYLLLPCILVVALRMRRGSGPAFSTVPLVAVAVIAITLTLRIATWVRLPVYSDLRNLFPSHLRLDSLFLGVAVAYFFQADRDGVLAWIRPRRVALMAGGLALLTPAFIFPIEESPVIYTAGLTFFAVGSSLLVLGALPTSLLTGEASRALAWIGERSYSIYLWHMPVARWLVPRLDHHLNLHLGYRSWILVDVVAAIAVGAMMAALVERPALAVRDRWFPSLSRTAPGALAVTG